jgi:hypothetical protein
LQVLEVSSNFFQNGAMKVLRAPGLDRCDFEKCSIEFQRPLPPHQSQRPVEERTLIAIKTNTRS